MDKKIIDYQVVYGNPGTDFASSMATTVKSEIKKGWQPLGGIAYETGTGRPAQAMVKYED